MKSKITGFIAVFFLISCVSVFAEGGQDSSSTAFSGTYRYDASYYITFTDSNFTGSWGSSTMSGTYSVSGSRLTLNITGGTVGRGTQNWTIVDANILRDQDGDSWMKEGGGSQASSGSLFNPQGVNAVDVYTAGSLDIGNRGSGANINYFNACYWKNSARIDLHPAVASDSTASSIIVVGTDVYVAGSCDYRACYWINGRRTDLSAPARTSSNATSIAVVGTDVYIAGHYRDGDNMKACYWKNGRRTDLSVPARTSSGATSIAIVGTDVYIAGHYGEYDWYSGFSSSRACYWKNGARTDLHPFGTSDSSTASITVVGTDVYVAGDYGGGVDFDSYYQKACYWKNGVKTDLSVPASISLSGATSIAVVGMDIYVAGNYRDGFDDKACYWKNGIKTDLSVPARTYNSTTSSATSITVVGTDVYVAGSYDYNNACYWINGRRTDLPAGTGTSTYVSGIAVSR
jgi:hypothetical protein